jgi:hypothetical protein
MSWNYKLVYKPNDVGRMLPRDILYSPDGIEIQADYSRDWSMRYSGRDLMLQFRASRFAGFLPKHEWSFNERSDMARCIGPDCIVRVDKRTLSRSLSTDEVATVAIDIKSAMRIHWQISSAFGPKVERIHFFNNELFQTHSDFLLPSS